MVDEEPRVFHPGMVPVGLKQTVSIDGPHPDKIVVLVKLTNTQCGLIVPTGTPGKQSATLMLDDARIERPLIDLNDEVVF